MLVTSKMCCFSRILQEKKDVFLAPDRVFPYASPRHDWEKGSFGCMAPNSSYHEAAATSHKVTCLAKLVVRAARSAPRMIQTLCLLQ